MFESTNTTTCNDGEIDTEEFLRSEPASKAENQFFWSLCSYHWRVMPFSNSQKWFWALWHKRWGLLIWLKGILILIPAKGTVHRCAAWASKQKGWVTNLNPLSYKYNLYFWPNFFLDLLQRNQNNCTTNFIF